MTYIVANRTGKWEIRESQLTAKGPRSRTLATFQALTQATIDKAQSRSSKALEPAELRAAAVRAGAPVAVAEVESAARKLLSELKRDRQPRPVIRRLLLAELVGDGDVTDSERAVAEWVAASPEERAKALYDLLLLADALPTRRRPDLRFPRLVSKSP